MSTQEKLQFDNVADTQHGFFVTTPLTGDERAKAIEGARSMDVNILKFFRQRRGEGFTPFEVWNDAGLLAYPITSVRRSINTLTKAGLLVKTDECREGEYRALNHIWRLA